MITCASSVAVFVKPPEPVVMVGSVFGGVLLELVTVVVSTSIEVVGGALVSGSGKSYFFSERTLILMTGKEKEITVLLLKFGN